MVLLFGRRYSEALTIANSLEQAQGRVFAQVRKIIETSPSLRDEARVTQDRITIAGATIQAIPSDAGSAAGSDQMISAFDELWAFDTERGHRLFDELVPPPTQKVACRLTVTYAGFSGELVLLEGLYKRGMKQPEVAPALRAGDGILMAWHHEPVAPWQDEAWIEEMRRSLRPYQFLRMVRNEWVTSESAFVEMEWYERCVDAEAGPLVADRGVPVYVGVDASVKRDFDGDSRGDVGRCCEEGPARLAPDIPADGERAAGLRGHGRVDAAGLLEALRRPRGSLRSVSDGRRRAASFRVGLADEGVPAVGAEPDRNGHEPLRADQGRRDRVLPGRRDPAGDQPRGSRRDSARLENQ